jgi:hypothetical protein
MRLLHLACRGWRPCDGLVVDATKISPLRVMYIGTAPTESPATARGHSYWPLHPSLDVAVRG